MDIDDLKPAWHSLDRRLERQNALAFAHFKDRRVETMQARLRPIYWGQMAQTVAGILVIVAGVAVWAHDWPVVPLRVAGLLVHCYGSVLLVFSGRTLWLMSRLDYAAPVVGIQRQLAELRRWYVLSGLVIGHAWWLLWMPAMMVTARLVAGVDLYRRGPRVFARGAVIGLVGMLVTWTLYRWARRPGWTWLAEQMEDAMTGASLRRAQAVLDEIRRFEDDGGDRPAAPAV